MKTLTKLLSIFASVELPGRRGLRRVDGAAPPIYVSEILVARLA